MGRGVLIDYKAYADANGITYSCFQTHSISIDTIEEIARIQGVTFQQGDIFLVRTGATEALNGKTAEEQEEVMKAEIPGGAGVESSVRAAKWFWNHHFAAAGGDSMAFECVDFGSGPENILVLHQHFLSLFGMPIGELWDLKELSEACAARKKWTFMLTSVPLNYPGCVGSPPNALAIF